MTTTESYTLYNCTDLMRTPDISLLANLKQLDLYGCNKLTQIPHVGKDSKLQYLCMIGCGELDKPLRKFEGTQLQRFLIDDVNDKNFKREAFMTEHQISVLDYCKDNPHLMDKLPDLNKQPSALKK